MEGLEPVGEAEAGSLSLATVETSHTGCMQSPSLCGSPLKSPSLLLRGSRHPWLYSDPGSLALD